MRIAVRFLAWFSFLCMPRKRFTQCEMGILRTAYSDAPVPSLAFAQFQDNPNSDEHIADLLLVMKNFPEWRLHQTVRDILNGTHQWRRAIGYGMFKALTVGADCTCCSGWRALLFCALSLVLGVAGGYAMWD
jgi:hypothetical protein